MNTSLSTESRSKSAPVTLDGVQGSNLSTLQSLKSDSEPVIPVLRQGCYLFVLVPRHRDPEVRYYHGTLRIEERTAQLLSDGQPCTFLRASADLYVRPAHDSWNPKEKSADPTDDRLNGKSRSVSVEPSDSPWPDPNGPIPVFPRERYFAYLETAPVAAEVRMGSSGAPESNSYSIQFRYHGFDHATRSFRRQGSLTMILSSVPPHAASRVDDLWDSEFEGRVINEVTGQEAGTVHLRRIVQDGKAALRRAHLDVLTLENSPIPRNNGEPRDSPDFADWQTVFEMAGWDLEVHSTEITPKDSRIAGMPRDPGAGWADDELQKALVQLRSPDSPDREWRFHLLCVSRFAHSGYGRGVSFDVAGLDVNDAPLEGAFVAADWPIPKPEEDPDRFWKNVPSGNLGTTPNLYFRTAAHEVGHATGLGHRHGDFGLMNTTDVIARDGTLGVRQARKEAALAELLGKADAIEPHEVERLKQTAESLKEFPRNILWRFSEKDLERLRHGPDVMVRPGAFNAANLPVFEDERPERAESFRLLLRPLHREVPLGAPVRVKLQLQNISDQPQDAVPASLHLKTGRVTGQVFHPATQTRRPFESLMVSMDSEAYLPNALGPGESLLHSITLMRGHRGPLFPYEGDYRIQIRVRWFRHGKPVEVEGLAEIRVAGAISTTQLLAARNLLDNPQCLLVLALGGFHDARTEANLAACLRDPVLAPHFRVMEIKRRLSRGLDEDLQEACELLRKDVVMSVSEIHRMRDLLALQKSRSSLGALIAAALDHLNQEESRLLEAEMLEGSPWDSA